MKKSLIIIWLLIFFTNAYSENFFNSVQMHIKGTNGNDVINGSRGNDILEGGYGDDIYIFNRGSGHDTIIESNHEINPGRNDKILFGADITKDDLIFRINGQYLEIGIKEANKPIEKLSDVIRIARFNWWCDYYTVKYIAFADRSIYEIKFIIDTKWNNHFTNEKMFKGTKGENDHYYGSKGNDTYFYERGSALDRIEDQGGQDTVVFGKGITMDDIEVKFDYGGGGHLEVMVGLREEGKEFDDYSDILFITAYNSQRYWMEYIKFADGTTMSYENFINVGQENAKRTEK